VTAGSVLPDLLRGPEVRVGSAASLEARNISAWFGTNKVLDRVSLEMQARTVTALATPSNRSRITTTTARTMTHSQTTAEAS
jgi:phosphate transport system ATP-binding protein